MQWTWYYGAGAYDEHMKIIDTSSWNDATYYDNFWIFLQSQYKRIMLNKIVVRFHTGNCITGLLPGVII